jgi:hypothetical protein
MINTSSAESTTCIWVSFEKLTRMHVVLSAELVSGVGRQSLTTTAFETQRQAHSMRL